ncbi:MAG: OmpA family protein [Burkholderiaceae bacterium]
MKKLIAFLFLVLLLVLFVGVVLFFRGAPQLTPKPLKPVLSWVDDAQIEVTETVTKWRQQYLNEPEPLVASDSATTAEPLSQVTLEGNNVSRVTVDENGRVAVEAREPGAAGSEQSLAAKPVNAAKSAAQQVRDEATPAATSALDTGTEQVQAPTQLAESTSAELNAIAKADAAIAAADAALARAQGLPVPASAQVPRPIETAVPARDAPNKTVDTAQALSVTDKTPATAAIEQAPKGIAVIQRATATNDAATPATSTTARTPQPTSRQTGGSALAGASAVLAQAATQSPTLAAVPAQASGRQATLMAAIPAPTILPPDTPAPAPAASPAGREQQAIITNFLAGKSVAFETGRDVLTPRGRQALQALLGIIEQNRNSIITIQGHTDSVGDERSNLELSTSRAIATRAYLIRRGVAPDRLLVQGFGETKPVSTNRTAAGREQNRRIDFAVSDG